jgi:hypothetical protein
MQMQKYTNVTEAQRKRFIFYTCEILMGNLNNRGGAQTGVEQAIQLVD